MQRTLWYLILGIILTISGCVRSLNPLFTEKDLVFKATLIGTWAGKDGEERWTFQNSGQNSYTLLASKGLPGDTVRFEAHLVQLGKYLFLDLFPKEEDQPKVKNELYNFQLIPVHTFWRAWIEEDAVRAAMLDNDWLKKMLDEQRIDIANERKDGTIILTAPTKELQLLVLKYAEDDMAFPKPGEFHRLK